MENVSVPTPDGLARHAAIARQTSSVWSARQFAKAINIAMYVDGVCPRVRAAAWTPSMGPAAASACLALMARRVRMCVHARGTRRVLHMDIVRVMARACVIQDFLGPRVIFAPVVSLMLHVGCSAVGTQPAVRMVAASRVVSARALMALRVPIAQCATQSFLGRRARSSVVMTPPAMETAIAVKMVCVSVMRNTLAQTAVCAPQHPSGTNAK